METKDFPTSTSLQSATYDRERQELTVRYRDNPKPYVYDG